MDVTPDIAFSAAQILAVLLVATMLDPWAKDGVAPSERRGRARAISYFSFSYGAKVLAVIVLLLDMQLVLFDRGWSGAQGVALGMRNYAAIALSGLAILVTVFSHIGALPAARSDPEPGGPEED